MQIQKEIKPLISACGACALRHQLIVLWR